ncbi:hypothetical protein GCK72_018693 [Caenorhabditis remanei]|uniref:G-protein coupled receptors family 1 profile domain-containing protein n=1 Tax=Caenorhabditis remanei TaxID=31234 RepID=A0A6A5GCL5_CAERE|nr:hypothetical protein GCK72_018693 [Caenorhabditis remanei]KAF1752139.1 hypothetical protein GCK72_018693 [Caenorhabditis remanei]
MIISNFIELLIEVFNDVIPLFLTAQTYGWLRQFMGEYTTLLDDFSYAFPMFLTVVMVAERFYVVFRPRGELFSDRKLWFYCLLLAIFTMVFCIIPFFSGCPINYDFYTFTYESQCEHIFTYLFDKYNGVIPHVCMFLNIGLILNLSCKRRKSHSANDADIICPELAAQIIFYSQKAAIGLTFFLIYFVGTPATRIIILEKAAKVLNKNMKTSSVNVQSVTKRPGAV